MKIVFLLLLCCFQNIMAQDSFQWWNAKHNWDGISPWHLYMTMSSSFMGPNALPVPEMTNGRIDSLAEVEISGSYHYSKGEKTEDIYLRGYLPLYNDRVAVSVNVIPYEWFKTDTITRDVRAARTKSGKGSSGGDIYFNTEFQIVKDKVKMPDVSVRAAFRLASGTNLKNARFTDGAGYFFDASAGKNFSTGKNILRLYVMAGFYAYQTHDIDHLQNDCLLFGAGADFRFDRFTISQSFSGYSGYLDIGDKPMVYRASIRKSGNFADWKLSYQVGINDYDFQRFRIGIVFHLNP